MARRGSTLWRLAIALLAATAVSWTSTTLADDPAVPTAAPRPSSARYPSPAAMALSRDGRLLYVADQGRRKVVVFDVVEMIRRAEIPVGGEPRALALAPDGQRLLVAERGAGSVALIDVASLKITGRIPVGKWPTALAVTDHPPRLYVGNQDRHTVSVVQCDNEAWNVVQEIRVVREPNSLAATPDGKTVVVANFLPAGSGLDPNLSAVVNIVDAEKLEIRATIALPPGSTLLQDVCTSPDGKWAYLVHGLGRFASPITQLERGWVNTYALSIIDLEASRRTATVLLDELTQGAADPCAVVCTRDGRSLWIAHRGVHEVSRVDMALLHRLLRGDVPASVAKVKDGLRDNIWVQIRQDRDKIAVLQDDLTALFIAGAIERFSSRGVGPQALALAADEATLFVANYYSGAVSVIETDSGRLQTTLGLGPQVEADAVRRGEIIFHDATRAFQRWHSCASCHANQGRVDGLRWDFLADGIGNGKDTMNLVFFHKTEPLNRRATVATALDCTRGGLRSTHGLAPSEQDVQDLYAYLTSLRPEPSPHLLPDGTLTDAARHGKQVFETRAGCARCHPAPYFTDRKMHNVGVLSPNEPDGRYDTPSLMEAYRTAPYLHDGRAVTIREVLLDCNPKGLHGNVQGLSDRELEDLIEYVLSL